MSLASLAAFATNNNNTRVSAKPLHELSIEECREKAVISDGNKKASEDGSQALTVRLGKYGVALDAIAPKATRVNATAEQVEEFTAILQEAINNGELDDALVEAQLKSVKVAPEAETTAPDGVDLEALAS